tara:strand:+ start:225 stop:476 length:252 start_codon:yes stop_codon:yes gene_type:complete
MKDFAKTKDAAVFDVSSKTGSHVEDVFNSMVQKKVFLKILMAMLISSLFCHNIMILERSCLILEMYYFTAGFHQRSSAIFCGG